MADTEVLRTFYVWADGDDAPTDRSLIERASGAKCLNSQGLQVRKDLIKLLMAWLDGELDLPEKEANKKRLVNSYYIGYWGRKDELVIKHGSWKTMSIMPRIAREIIWSTFQTLQK